MKVSLNWLNKYGEFNSPIDQLIEKIGAQLGAVDEVVDFGSKYQGIYVVKVVSCQKHTNADTLSVCLIDDGGVAGDVARNEQGLVQVVCGAPNVKAGVLVIWLPPGLIVPSSVGKDEFKLEAREIRGQISNGMLASPKELALWDNHEGLLLIDKETAPGTPFIDMYGLKDYIIDIENKMFTHRPDCFGMLGIAREIAGINQQQFKSPDWYSLTAQIPESKNSLKLQVNNEVKELVPRFLALAISGLEVRDSPVWLQIALSRVSIKPINNIVDITNFYMMQTGQPLHAYDYDKVKDGAIGVRLSKSGENLKLIGGKELKLDEGLVVITDASGPIGLGGVMGGADTQVDGSTKNIILECATFDMNATRKSAMKYGLYTDAATRYTKGQSPLQNLAVLSRALQDITKLAGGEVASPLIDVKGALPELPIVSLSADFINSRLGSRLSAEEITNLLQNVEFKASTEGGQLSVTAPFWRTDIAIAEDVVEEVGRLHGYNDLPQVLPRRYISPVPKNPSAEFKSRIRDLLSDGGLSEALTYSFTHGSLMQAAGQELEAAYHLRNARSPDLQYYRISLVPSLLNHVHQNIKAGYTKFGLFEIGKGHIKGLNNNEGLPVETEKLSIVLASKDAAKDSGAPYYTAKHYCQYLIIKGMGIANIKYSPLADAQNLSLDWQATAKSFEPARSAAIFSGDTFLGLVGEPTAKLRSALKLPKFTSMVELNIEVLEKLAARTTRYKPLNRFPAIEQDLCLRMSSGITYREATELLRSVLNIAAKEHGYSYRIKPLDIFRREDDPASKQITWRITLEHSSRTLTTEEVNKLFDILSAEALSKLKAERI